MLGISYIRELYDLTLEDLASKLDISKQAVNNWEKGKNLIAENRLEQLEELFAVPRDFFQKELDEIDKLEIQRHILESKCKIVERKVTDYMGTIYTYNERIYESEIDEKIKKITIEIEKAILFKNINSFLNIENFSSFQEYSVRAMQVIGAYVCLIKTYESKKVSYDKLDEILNAIVLAYEIEKGHDARPFVKDMVKLIQEDSINLKRDYALQRLLARAFLNEEEQNDYIRKLNNLSKEVSFLYVKRMVNDKLYEAYEKDNKEFLNKIVELIGIDKVSDQDIEDLKIF